MNVLRPSRARFLIALLLPVLALLSAAPAAAQQDFYTVPLCRAYDSRGGGGPLDPGTVYTVTLAGVCGVPANAAIVALNVTIISPEPGTLVTFPAGGTPPSGSPPPDALVFRAGRTQAKNYQVALGAGGAVSFRADTAPGNPDIYHAIIDVAGYYLSNTTVVDDAATVSEDAAATAIDVLANDTDPDDTLTIASATDPAHGTVVLTGGTPGAHTGLTYQPDADYCGSDTFNYTVNPSGDIGTVTVTVTCVDDNPVAVDDAATVTEDDPATAINVLANDTDVENDPFTIASATDPAHGTVVVTGGGTGLTYQPDANYCGSDTFDYTLTPGGDTATVTITVTCVEGNPVAVDDAATVAEDAPATAIDVLANDSDDEGDPFTIASATDPAHGTVVVTGGGTGLTYQPDANYCGLDTFDYTLTPGGDTATVSVTVTCADDNPVAVDDAATVTEDDPATAINVLANDTDVENDPFTIASATDPAHGTVVVTGGGTGLTYQPDANYCGSDTFDYTLTPGGDVGTVTVTVTCVNDDPVAVDDVATVAEDAPATALPVLVNDSDVESDAFTIASATDPAHGTVVVTGGGTGLTYQPDANYCGADTFDYTLTPGGDTATVSVTVTCVDDNPTAVADAATVTEDSGATAIDVLANDTDPDGGPISITSVTQPANGTVVITGGGTGLTYAPAANYCNTPPGTTLATFTYTLTPGGSSTTVTVSVTCVDDNPTAVADATTVVEDSVGNAINVLGNDTDPDGGSISVAAVTQPANGSVVITGGGTGVSYTPNPNYCNVPPGTTLETFTYTLTPGGSSTTVTVSVTCVDDPPTAVADAATVVEDSGANAISVLANDTDVDGGPISITSVTQPANGVVVITGGGTGLTYAPNANYCNTPPGTTLSTFTYTLTPGGSSTTVTVSVTCVNDPPVAGTDNFETFGNTELRVDLAAAGTTPHVPVDLTGAPGVMNNDSDPVEGTPVSFTGVVGCADVTAPFECSTANGGQITIEADGSFSYRPPQANPAVLATDSTDSFQYTIVDGEGAPATGTVNLIRREVIWYVDPTAVAGGDGRSHNPFQSFASLNGVAGAGDLDNADDYIVVHDGTFAGNASIELEAGQRLIGQGVGLSLPLGSQGTKEILPATTHPQIDNASGDVIRVTSAVPARIAGLSLSGSLNAIDMPATGAYTGSGTLTIESNIFRGAGAEGIDINAGATGTLALNIQNNSWSAAGTHAGNAVDVNATTGALQLNISNNTNVLSTGASAIVAGAVSPGTLTITGFTGNTVHQNTAGNGISINAALFDATPGGAVNRVYGGNTRIGTLGDGVGATGLSLTNVTGDLAFGDELTVGDLDVYSTGAALTATSTVVSGVPQFRLTVTPPANGGSSTLVATAGAAVDIDSVTADLRLSGLTSVGGLKGVSLVRVLPGSFPAQFHAPSGSSITTSNAGATAFRVDQSNASVTYQGTINTTAGKGVELTSNTGSTIGFSGTLTLSTGASPAFAATGGGTVTSTDAASTLTTTSGTALNVANTTMGASGLTFRSISAGTSGTPANGILLDSTGTGGTLTVTGTSSTTLGGDGSGGVIQNATGATGSTSGIGVYVRNARATLRRMHIRDSDNYGIFGTGTMTFNLEYSTVDSTETATSVNGDSASADDEEGSVAFEEWAGSGSIVSSVIGDGFSNNLRILNTNGSDLDRLTVSNSTFNNNGLAGNNNIHVESRNSGTTVNFTLQGSTIKGARADWLNASNNSSSAMDLVISGNAFSNLASNAHAAAAAGGNRLVLGSVGTMTYDILNNTLSGSKGEAIRVRSTAASGVAGVASGTISGNDIGLPGTANSGSSESSGIFLFTDGGGDQTALVTNNRVYQYNNHGIRVDVGDEQVGASVVNVTVTNNTVEFPGNLLSDFNGIHVNHGTVAATDDFTSCIDVRLNDVTGSGNGGVYPNNAEIRLRQRQNTTIVLPGYTGLNNEDCNVVAFVAGQNTVNNSGAGSCTNGSPNPPTKNAAATTQNATTTVRGFESGAACIQP